MNRLMTLYVIAGMLAASCVISAQTQPAAPSAPAAQLPAPTASRISGADNPI